MDLFSSPSFLFLAQKDGDRFENISVSEASRMELTPSRSMQKYQQSLSVFKGSTFWGYDLGSSLQSGFAESVQEAGNIRGS